MTTLALTIGKVAALANVSIETIRYYQQIGLLQEPAKPLRGFRIYNEDNIRRLKFIKKAQRLGFSLPEISELLDIGSGQCSDIQAKAKQKRNQICQQIKELKALESTLDSLIDSCDITDVQTSCPIVMSLSNLSEH